MSAVCFLVPKTWAAHATFPPSYVIGVVCERSAYLKIVAGNAVRTLRWYSCCVISHGHEAVMRILSYGITDASMCATSSATPKLDGATQCADSASGPERTSAQIEAERGL